MRRWTSLLVVVAACVPTSSPSVESAPPPTAPPTTTTTAALPEPTSPTDPDFEIRVGVLSRPLFDPVLAAVATSEATPYGIPDQASLYRVVPPTGTVIPMVAADPEPPPGRPDGDEWVIDLDLRSGATWDDGTPIDAEDVAFSYALFSDLHLPAWDNPSLRGVEVLDESTVRLRWRRRPTVDEYQLGVGLAPIVSAGFWQTAGDRSREGLLEGLDPTLIPTAGPYRLVSVDGDSWTLEAVDPWWEAGSSFTVWDNGAVRYLNPTLGLDETYGEPAGDVVARWTTGPYAGRVVFRTFGVQDRALQAMFDDEIDLILSGAGIQRGLHTTYPGIEELFSRRPEVTWLAFDTRRTPFDDPAWRRAVACLVDRPFLAESVFGGAVIDTRSWGSGFGPWSIVGGEVCSGDREQRGTAARKMIDDPDVGRVRIVARAPDVDPIATTTGLFVETWLVDIGVDAELHDFTVVAGDRLDTVGDWEILVLDLDVTGPRLLAELDTVRDVTGWDPPGVRILADQARHAFDLPTAQATLRDLQRALDAQLPALPLYGVAMLELFRGDRIAPPFVPPEGPSPLVGGLQAWEDWVLPALRPARG